MRQSNARAVALGGMLTAAAVVIMSLGSIIPINTYVCPVACILMSRPVLTICGRKIGWCYYLAVAILSLLLAPDREAALVYVFLGYYPMIRHHFGKIRVKGLRIAAKLSFFTLSGAAVYALLIWVMGVEEILGEAGTPELILLGVAVLMWDFMLMMVDQLLELGIRLRRRKK